ncbi:MAG: ABC transporter permease, partial [Oligoflexus sp.]
MLTLLNIAFRNLLQAKRRTILLSFAVAVVALLFLVLRSVSASVSERMIESATTLSAGHVNVGGFFKSRRKGNDPLVTERSAVKSFVKEQVPEAVSVIDRSRGWGRLISGASSINVGFNGIEWEEEDRFFNALRLAPEKEYRSAGGDRTYGSFDDLKKPNTVLIFAAQAKKLEVGVGDTLTFVTEASGGQSNTVDLQIVAIASDIGFMSNWSVFVPRQTLLDLYRISSDTTGVIMVYLKRAEQAEAVMGRLRQALKDKGWTVMDHDPNPFFIKFDRVAGEDWLGQRLDLTIWSDEISFVLWVTTALDLVSFFVIGVLAVIIIGGIMNAMWMSVRERTKEIGTMRAIGAQKGFVIQMFVVEALLLGLIASCIGITFGGLGLAIVNSLELPIKSEGVRLFLMSNTFRFVLHPMQFVST